MDEQKSCSQKLSGLFLNLGLGLALAGGLVCASLVVTKSMERIRGNIEVKGYAERKIKSDSASWNVRVMAYDADMSKAYTQLEAQMSQVVAFIESAGIPNLVLNKGAVTRTPRFARDERGNALNTVEGYDMEQSVSLTSSHLQKVHELSRAIESLRKQGVDLATESPSYLVAREKLEKVKIELLAEATKSARERADQFATNSGTNIGRLVSARQGVFQVTGENSTDVSDYGTYDTSAIDKIVKIVVTLSYTTGS